jgi:hypothetical protein
MMLTCSEVINNMLTAFENYEEKLVGINFTESTKFLSYFYIKDDHCSHHRLVVTTAGCCGRTTRITQVLPLSSELGL